MSGNGKWLGSQMHNTLQIYLSDPADVVAKKVKSMYTDPNHLRVEDPDLAGRPVVDLRTVEDRHDCIGGGEPIPILGEDRCGSGVARGERVLVRDEHLDPVGKQLRRREFLVLGGSGVADKEIG